MGPGGKQCEMHSEWATLQWENPWKTRSGQSLAAINHAAGVNVILDQTHKFSGYSHAKIFGSEEMQPRHFQHGTVKCLVHFEALNFGGQSEKCQVGHRLQVVTMASTPWKAERHHCCSQSTSAAIGWKSRVWSLNALEFKARFQVDDMTMIWCDVNFHFDLATWCFFIIWHPWTHTSKGQVCGRALQQLQEAGATNPKTIKIHILWSQNPQPGTSPVKEIEDSAVPWKQ